MTEFEIAVLELIEQNNDVVEGDVSMILYTLIFIAVMMVINFVWKEFKIHDN